MNVLSIDVGGTHVKCQLSTNSGDARSFSSDPTLTAQQMCDGVKERTADWQYEAVSVGVPAPVLHDKLVHEPHNLGTGWVEFDFQTAFGRPTKLINDAAMQALGDYDGGRMLFPGLGTGLGSAMIVDGILQPMELAHLPYKDDRTFEDEVGARGLERLGESKWRTAVADVVAKLKAALEADYVVIGGGNARLLDDLPEGVKVCANSKAFLGGVRLWDDGDAESKANPTSGPATMPAGARQNEDQRITTLFLDIGGVLLTNGWDRRARRRAAETFGLDEQQLNDRHHLTFDTYEVGKLSLEHYLDRIVFYEERDFSRDDFRDFMFAQSQAFPDMIEFMQAVKHRNNLRVAAVSNEGHELTKHRIAMFQPGRLFDFFVSSCFVHFRKPDVDIYRVALDIAQARPNEIVYIDDRPMFVEVANGLGIQGVVHHSLDETAMKLAAFGLAPVT